MIGKLLEELSDKKDKYIEILNNIIEYLYEQGKSEEQILAIFGITKEEADELNICI